MQVLTNEIDKSSENMFTLSLPQPAPRKSGRGESRGDFVAWESILAVGVKVSLRFE